MVTDNKLWIAKAEQPVYLHPKMANRHGLIAGATGTGKTITLKVLAESFSAMGVPVFLADIKGDLSGCCVQGQLVEAVQKRIDAYGLQGLWNARSFPTRFWDVYGEQGMRLRTTISEMGSLLLARILDLNDTQTDILSILFRIADEQQLLLLDMKDLKAMLQYCADNAKELTRDYGNISPQSIATIQRSLIALEEQGGDIFFCEPALDIQDLFAQDSDGRGFLNILHCVKLFNSPQLYATFLLWLMSELYESLPEVGDLDRPKMVFFFDEAHLLFNDAPKVLLQKIEQVVRLIRSKGVGIYFITQNPTDVPNDILTQLGNRVQHALRAFSPADQKALKSAAQTFRQNPAFDSVAVLQELGTGEALVSFLDEKGTPQIVERAFILPPESTMGPCDETTRQKMIAGCPLSAKYNQEIDRESAFERLTQRVEQPASAAPPAPQAEAEAEPMDDIARQKAQLKREREELELEKERVKLEQERAALKEAKKPASHKSTRKSTRMSTGEKVASAMATTAGRQIASTFMRGLLGSLKKKW